MRDEKSKIGRLSLVLTASVSIGLGFLKIYTHYYSIFRSGPLDYFMAFGAIFGGLMVLTKKATIVISSVCMFFLALEVLKAIVDFRDLWDFLLCTIATVCLVIPLIRYAKR